VLPEGGHDDIGQRNRAMGGQRLRWAEEGLAAGEQDELLVDAQGVAVEVEVLVVESEALALPQAGSCREQDEGPVAFGHCFGERVDGRGAQWDDLGRAFLRELRAVARGAADEAVPHGGLEDRRDDAVDDLNGGR
jgi:hypothetical protein